MTTLEIRYKNKKGGSSIRSFPDNYEGSLAFREFFRKLCAPAVAYKCFHNKKFGVRDLKVGYIERIGFVKNGRKRKWKRVLELHSSNFNNFDSIMEDLEKL